MSPADEAYGPVPGTDECRDVIADHYNRLYRPAKSSQYSRKNVIVCPGGRLALLRVLASLRAGRLGYLTPDYMSFESLMEMQAHRLTPVSIHLPNFGRDGLPLDLLTQAIHTERLTALLLSNPSNPIGNVLSDDELRSLLTSACASDCTLVMDEFYSQYIYERDGSPADAPVSVAAHVSDVEHDPVLIVDGLTKNFRYPGWRLSWIVGPSTAIEELSRVATGMDGGASTVLQRAALEVLEPDSSDRETSAIRTLFAQKRRLMIERLRALGVRVHREPQGAFYVWGDLSGLPYPFNNSRTFFDSALDRKVVTIPGALFDLNPCGRRPANPGFETWMRFSYGPDAATLRRGLDRIAEMVKA